MAKKTVRDMLDDYHAGKASLDDVAHHIRNHPLGPTRPVSSAAQMFGAADSHVPGPDEWQTVEHDPRLSTDDYQVLAAAHADSLALGLS